MFFRKSAYPHIISRIADVLFPKKCVGCNKEYATICTKCFRDITQKPQIHRSHVSFFQYNNKIVRKAIWELKYKGRKDVAIIFAPTIRKRLDAMFPSGDIIIVPIPLSRKRRWSRGFNQTEVLAREIARTKNPPLPFGSYIHRSKHSSPQTLAKSKKERLQNIIGAFRVPRPDEVSGKRIVVIDDITTTGATLNEAIKVLKQAGAKEVIGLAVAH